MFFTPTRRVGNLVQKKGIMYNQSYKTKKLFLYEIIKLLCNCMQKGGENSETNQKIFQPKRLAVAVFMCGMFSHVSNCADCVWYV